MKEPSSHGKENDATHSIHSPHLAPAKKLGFLAAPPTDPASPTWPSPARGVRAHPLDPLRSVPPPGGAGRGRIRAARPADHTRQDHGRRRWRAANAHPARGGRRRGDGGVYEPCVMHHFLDLAYRYVGDMLGDAQVYADHAVKPQLDAADVRLAIQAKVNLSFSQPKKF
ncbi:hypothetical protein ZWY2020_028054 [Hordeum vulgare]|nr:hypothetical protein ZWY2020_028054 [Hordeum vulgare]